jgi:hypothetical protein
MIGIRELSVRIRIRNTVSWNLGLNAATFRHSAPVAGVTSAVSLQQTCGRRKSSSGTAIVEQGKKCC